MHFDDDRVHNPQLHCPTQYARAGFDGDGSPGAMGVGWLRHEWRQRWARVNHTNQAVPQGHYCIHCREFRDEVDANG